MSLDKDTLVKRIQEIDAAINEGKKALEEQCAHLNVLDGQRRETLHWLYKVENPEVQSTKDIHLVDKEPSTSFADNEVSPDTHVSVA